MSPLYQFSIDEVLVALLVIPTGVRTSDSELRRSKANTDCVFKKYTVYLKKHCVFNTGWVIIDDISKPVDFHR